MLPLCSLAVAPLLAQPAQESWKDQGILNLTRSPQAKLRNVPIRAVTITSGFWAERRKANVERSIPSMRDTLVANGRMENFRRLTGKSKAAQTGPVYADAHIYKWIEAAGFALQSGNNPALRKMTDDIIDDVVAVQEPGGYLNTYYVEDRASQRMLPSTQSTGHEVYNIGHLVQAGIATYRATGDRKLLDAGIRFFDNFVIKDYGPEAAKKPLVSGHPGTELAMTELYRITGEKRYLDLAGYLLRGDPARMPFPESRYVYMFSGSPFTARTQLEGHAVRAMYATAGAADYYLETGDQNYWKTLEVLWKDLVGSKMYITGGVGARSSGEAFGDPYELPNLRAYGESCAAIGNMMWNWRMLAATGEGRFTDVIERVLYNGINSGMSLDGTTFCYRNPLEYEPASGKIRNAWYTTNCCPSNLQRIFAALPRLHVQHQPGWPLCPPLPEFRDGLASGERHRTQGVAENRISLGRQCGCYHRARTGVRIHRLPPNPLLGHHCAGVGERPGGERSQGRGVPASPPALGPGGTNFGCNLT